MSTQELGVLSATLETAAPAAQLATAAAMLRHRWTVSLALRKLIRNVSIATMKGVPGVMVLLSNAGVDSTSSAAAISALAPPPQAVSSSSLLTAKRWRLLSALRRAEV